MAKKVSSHLMERVRKLIVVVLIVGVLAAVQFWLWPFVEYWTLVFHETRSREQQVDEVAGRVKIISDHYDRLQVLLEQLTAVIPNERNTLQVIDRLEVLASQLELSVVISAITEDFSDNESMVQEEDNTEALDAEGVFPLLVSVSVSGKIVDILKYIDEVEHSQELTMMHSLKIAPVSLLPGEEVFAADVEVIFYLKRT